MIRAVIFDCFGVLTTDKWRDFVAELPERQRIPASELNRAYGRAQIDKQEFLRAIKELTGKQPQDIDKLIDNDDHKNARLLEYIKTLKPEHKIGLLSNVASNWIRDHFLSEEEQKLFDDILLSYEVRMTKPDPEIFELAAQRLGLEPNECVLVDDVEYYCSAAQTTGMKAVCYQDYKQAVGELNNLLKRS